MFPDGGIPRFRLYGRAIPLFPEYVDQVFDLAAAVNGGVAIKCSDQHFGTKDNLLLPERSVDMCDGWEAKRMRGPHVDWVIIRLGVPGEIETLVVDTALFRGNFPKEVQVFAGRFAADREPAGHQDEECVEVLRPQKTGPDREHVYEGEGLRIVRGAVYAHVKLVIIPDGGVKRFRVFGRRKGRVPLEGRHLAMRFQGMVYPWFWPSLSPPSEFPVCVIEHFILEVAGKNWCIRRVQKDSIILCRDDTAYT